MPSRPIRDISEYPRPWFYRPEIYYGLFIFPPVWSILTLRSPWHNRAEGFRGIIIGGIAWFIIIASVVFAVKWIQADDDGNRQIANLYFFVPGLLLTLLTQIQWTAHRAEHGPPPTEEEREEPAPVAAAPARESRGSEEPGADEVEGSDEDEGTRDSYAPRRRRRRRRRRPINRSSDADAL